MSSRSRSALTVVLVVLSTLAGCASAGGSSSAPVTRLADRDLPALRITGDTAPCAGVHAVQFVDVKNPSPREVTVAAHAPNGLAPLSSDNLLRPFEKRRYVFAASVQLTGFSAWTFDPGIGIGRNAKQLVDVEPKRSCGER
jgi:hypothetical protein